MAGLYSYIGGIYKEMECHSIKIGGYTEHIHILCMLSKKIALMKLLEEVKSHSSPKGMHSQKWMKTKGTALKNFYWQNGYGAFSVNPSEIDKVIAYIENQKEHHKKKTFLPVGRQVRMNTEHSRLPRVAELGGQV